MNFGSIVVLFLIFSIINSILEGGKRKRSKPTERRYYQAPPFIKDMTNKTPIEAELTYDDEGISIEDNSKTGSLNYIELNNSEEGIQTESVKRDLIAEEEKPVEVKGDRENEYGFNDLQRSIVLAEVLGPPRVLKRNIR